MKNTITICLILLLSTSLFSLKLNTGKFPKNINRPDLMKMNLVSKKCKSEKENSKFHIWKGVKLSDLINIKSLKKNDIIRISSKDNYQVDLSINDLKNNLVLIALFKDEKELDNNHLRLIIPQKREMYWIKDVYYIEKISKKSATLPHIIYIAENIIDCNNSDKIQFSEFSDFFPKFADNEYIVVAKDGISHSFSFKKYLKNAVIITKHNNYKLLSKTMPLGMWVNNLCFIQNQDTGILFLKNFDNFNRLASIMKWKLNDKKITLINKDGTKNIIENKDITAQKLQTAQKILL